MRTVYILALAVPLSFAASCSVVTNPGRFVELCTDNDPADVTVALSDFGKYNDNRIEIRVQRGDELLLRGVLEGIDDEGALPESGPVADNTDLLCVTFPDLGEAGADNVRVYVDLDDDGEYDPLVDEPGWQFPIDDGLAVLDALFDDPLGFDPPSAGPGDLDFELELTGMNPHVVGTQHLAAMIIDDETGFPIGFYRVPDVDLNDLEAADLTLTILALLRPDQSYTVEFYADKEANGVYDSPVEGGGGDHSWVQVYNTDADGLIGGTFAHRTPFVPLDSFD